LEYPGKALIPGAWIREMRERRMVKPREVERITRAIAEMKGNPDFYISHSTLAGIEAGSIPTIHKLYSLAVVFKVTLGELLLPFGIDLDALQPFGMNQASLEPAFRFQLNFDTKITAEETTLLNPRPQDIEGLPSVLQTRVDLERYRYAVIGLEDNSMADLIPARSVVEIDTTQNVVQIFAWRTLRERPIYMVWHNLGYSCCWCQVDGRELSLIPHPLSQQPVRRFKMPGEANVIGKVTSAWLPFSSTQLQRGAL
jgi:transcriptional regulator with XRE-family HTH domain